MTELSTNSETINPFALSIQAETPPAINEEAFNAIVTATAWLPTMKLISNKSSLCGAPNNLKAGNWYLKRGSKYQDLGTAPVVLIAAMRTKAVESSFGPQGEQWTNYYDVKSPDFQRVIGRANQKGMTGAFYGPEYLVWIDGALEAGGGDWATLMCANESSRIVSGELNSAVKGGFPLVLPTSVATKGKFSFEVFTPTKFAGVVQYYPTMEELEQRRTAFLEEAAKGATVETAQGDQRPQ